MRHGLCPVKNGIKLYQPRIGNDNFHQHVYQHGKNGSTSTKPIVVSNEQKRKVIYAAVIVVAMDVQLLSFCHRRKVTRTFAETLIEFGQMYGSAPRSNVENLSPCGDAVRAAIIRLTE